ncbi:RNA-binding protein [Chitinophaga parva]|uniref:RNA-binding protein n=1 Tax=Chitinophaga parva TaxID=2169414 RepID=A0A2T7BEN3_9BACT|nr:S1-like domain-containing RNA-binding protein [Chitinophaga parva]PUZ24734.1 RNA-binding protein [Chitinophaga parva]
MIQVGRFNRLSVKKTADFGLYLDGFGEVEILLPKRFVPEGLKVGDPVDVFIYHDSENRLIATTQKPYGVVGDIVRLKAVAATKQGAFLDWGLMKDLFVPLSQQVSKMVAGGEYLVRIYIDEQTGRVAATEKLFPALSNDNLTVQEKDEVDLQVYRRSELGYVVIINNVHSGLLHYSDVFRELEPGDKLKGFIKAIKEGNKIDVGVGKAGYAKVEDESSHIMALLDEHNGYLPYNDKSDPEAIRDFFGMSKKTFKMTTGALYKQQKIEFTQTGIKKIED